MKKLLKNICVFAFGAACVLAVNHYWPFQQEALAASASESDLKIPGEQMVTVVTKDEIESKLVEIRELTTYSGEYTSNISESKFRATSQGTRYPGTEKIIAVKCDGIVKVGCNVEDIQVEVDNDSKRVYITLPPIEVLDNYVIMESVDTSGSKNNILNPIEFGDYQEILEKAEADGLQNVTGKGIYEEAEKTMEMLVRNCLGSVTDYEIVFM